MIRINDVFIVGVESSHIRSLLICAFSQACFFFQLHQHQFNATDK